MKKYNVTALEVLKIFMLFLGIALCYVLVFLLAALVLVNMVIR